MEHACIEAMDHIEEKTCLRFLNGDSSSAYILFRTDKKGCYGNSIGRNTNGVEQTINLGDGCVYKGTILHA